MKIKLRSGTVSGIAVILRKKGVRDSVRDSRYLMRGGVRDSEREWVGTIVMADILYFILDRGRT